MLPVRFQNRLTTDQIRAAMQNTPGGINKPRRWRPRRWMYYAATVLVIGLWAWMLATDQVGPAIDHELDRMPTAEIAVVDEPADLDRELLAALIHAEARGESFDGKVAVGAVVMNRVDDPRWPDTVEAVVLQPGQFAEPTEATPEAERAAREALQGHDPTGGAVYFYNPEVSRCGWIVTRETVTEIGGHRFAR